MAKLDINALRYLVMEGGGARGTTYLGAIRALEKQLKKRAEDVLENVELAELNGRNPGVVDFENDEDGERTPVIEGVAGGSAGAITTFALALGLNSDEIATVLEYDFKNFLSEEHAGRYRMIGPNSELMVGEDHKGEMGSKKSDSFEYDLSKDFTKVKGNILKKLKRQVVIGLIVKILVDGIAANVGKLIDTIEGLFKNGNEPTFVQRVKQFLLDNANNFFVRLGGFLYGPLINFGLFKFIQKKADVKFTPAILGGLFADRGLYSGFRVREFFYDLIIFAATRNTRFRRGLLEYYDGKTLRTGRVVLEGSEFNYPGFEIGKRSNTDFKPVEKKVLEHLKDLTFAEFYEITGIDFCAAVSNFTAGSPVYFSDKYTPHFRILEAVSGSMSIPPAIRPLLNESNVYLGTDDEPYRISFPYNSGAKGIQVKVDGSPETFVDANGMFRKTDYDLYEFVVKKVLQTELLRERSRAEADIDTGESETEETYVDLNNVIDLNTFLPILHRILIGDGNGDLSGRKKLSLQNREVLVNGKTYEVSDDLLAFFYNAQYKGLLLDGGYLNNIPYNYFRDPVKRTLDGVLAVKLDHNFPPDFVAKVHAKIQGFLKSEEKIKDNVDSELTESDLAKLGKKDAEYETLINYVKTEFAVYFENQKANLANDLEGITKPKDLKKAEKEAREIDRESIAKFLDQWLKIYGRKNYIKPWAVPKSILQTAFEGYFYGAERGQVRFISDHDHIVPLYDFGVGTYDFDMSKVRPLEKMAQTQAEIAINAFFE